MEKDYYKILESDRSATVFQIKKAFRRLAFKFHPDRNESDPAAEEKFKEVQEAYGILGNVEKRTLYDLKFNAHSLFNYFEQYKKNLPHYFYVISDKDSLPVNEEVKVTFTYSGQGRLFKRPEFTNFFLTAAPYVSFRNIYLENIEVRETSLTYIIAPLIKGSLSIDKALIKIENKTFATAPLLIEVNENSCYFTRHRAADGEPFKYLMNYEAESESYQSRILKEMYHTVLIPRSHFAGVYHHIGFSMKIFFLLWGAGLSMYAGFNFFLGGMGGLAFGGLMCNLLYSIARVKPKFYFAKKYFTVQNYLTQGYKSGTDTGSRLLNSEVIHFITSFLF